MRRRKRQNKSKSQKTHALNRAKQRVGWGTSQQEIDDCIRQIISGEAKFYERQSNRVTKWWVTIDGKEVIAVYDKNRKTIVTFITKEMLAMRPT